MAIEIEFGGEARGKVLLALAVLGEAVVVWATRVQHARDREIKVDVVVR